MTDENFKSVFFGIKGGQTVLKLLFKDSLLE